jgi:hypothetical protein
LRWRITTWDPRDILSMTTVASLQLRMRGWCRSVDTVRMRRLWSLQTQSSHNIYFAQQVTKTDTWQTRPLVREGAPKDKTVTLKKKILWSKVPDWARHQDILIDWPSVVTWLWLWDHVAVCGLARALVTEKLRPSPAHTQPLPCYCLPYFSLTSQRPGPVVWEHLLHSSTETGDGIAQDWYVVGPTIKFKFPPRPCSP